LIGGAGLATHRDVILSSTRSDLQKILSVSQFLQGYGYAMYQYNYISENPKSLNCDVKDFPIVLNVTNDIDSLKSRIRNKMNQSLRCITRWRHQIKYYSSVTYAHYLQEMINQHFNILTDIENVEKARRKLIKTNCNVQRNILREKRDGLVEKLDDTIADISKNFDESFLDKPAVYGGAIIFGSLLQIFGQYLLDHQSETSILRNAEVANYGSLALYGAGFGWPNVIENNLQPRWNECKLEESPVRTMMNIFDLNEMEELIIKYEENNVISAILEFKKILQTRMACYNSELGHNNKAELSFHMLDELEELLLLQVANEVQCPNA